MTVIAISKFFGEATGVTPRQIPQGFARKSRNTDVSLGTLKPSASPSVASEPAPTSSAKTLYRYPNGKWFSWTTDVDIVRSPLIDDAWGRVYWTGQGEPKMAAVNNATSGSAPYPNSWYTLGVPAPSSAPVAAGADTPEGGEPTTAVTAFYSVAYVTEYGEVGPLSLPSGEVTRWDDGGDVTVSLPAINAPGRNVTKLRIFRAETGGSFMLVADVPAGTASYVDSIDSENLKVPADSIDFDPPPENMKGLIAGPGGALYGFFDNVLCASEPGYPHAWPTDYRLAFQDDIVGIAESAAGIVVATKGMPWVVIGATPSALGQIKIETMEPCLSKRSIVDMGDYVVYASPNGLVGIGGQGANLMTKNLMSRAEWKKINPSSIHAYRERDRYLAFYTDLEGGAGCFAFSPDRGFEFVESSAGAAFYSGELDTLFIHDGSSTLKSWGEGEAQTLQWRSGIFEVQPGTSFTCGKIVSDQYPVTIKLHADGNEAAMVEVASNGMFRLPSGLSNTREWEIELISDYEVFSAQIAQSPQELI